MKKMSLQWRLTCIITLYIAVICGCVTMLVYKNGVYYMDSLQEAVDTRGDDQPDDAEEIYISIPEDKWDEFANDFSVQVYNNKAFRITVCWNASRMHLRYRDNLLQMQPMSFVRH